MSGTVKEKKARIFRNGRSRAVRIPKEFDLDGDEVVLRQDSDGVITMTGTRKRGLLALLDSLEPLADEDAMPEIEDFPPEPVELGWSEK